METAKGNDRSGDSLMVLAEANVLFYGLHEWIEKSMRSGSLQFILQGACEFIEGHLGGSDVRFTFIGAEPKPLRIAATLLGRFVDRDPALAAMTGEPLDLQDGDRTYLEIRGRARLLGYISVVEDPCDDAARRERRTMLDYMASQLGLLCDNALMFEQMRELSRKDPLTGLLNRRALEEFAQIFVDEKIRSVLYMVDLDRFKVVNDTYGHGIGDEVLKKVAHAICESTRGGDVVARYGGEEITIILTDLAASDAQLVGDRFRVRVEQQDWKALGLDAPVTVSIGAAALLPQDCGPGEWIRRADEALYRAKQSGRNRVVVCEEVPPPSAAPSAETAPEPESFRL